MLCLYLINDTAEIAFEPVRGYLPFLWQQCVDNVGFIPEQDFCLGFKAVEIRNRKGISAGLEDGVDAAGRFCGKAKGRCRLLLGAVIIKGIYCEQKHKKAPAWKVSLS